MDLFKAIAKKGGESFLFPLASALDNNDFHESLHGSSYGMHFKINRPYHIQSEPLKYEDIAIMVKNAGARVLKQIVRMPKKGHGYYWIVPELDKSAVVYKEKPTKTEIKVDGALLTGFKIISKGETYFIPRDLGNLRSSYNFDLFMGVVPDTRETFYFMSLSADQINYLADLAEDFDCNLYLKIGGIFITTSLDEDKDLLLENFHRIFEILDTFFQEVGENGINLYSVEELHKLFNLDRIIF